MVTMPASLQPGVALPNGATVLAARFEEQPSTSTPYAFVVLALNGTHEYVVWRGHFDKAEGLEGTPVTYWGNYYPAEHVESLARATARFYALTGTHSAALLLDEVKDMVEA